MEDIFSFLPIIIAIFVALSSRSEKAKGNSKGFEPREFEFPKWLTQKIPGIEILMPNNESVESYSYGEPFIVERTIEREKAFGAEGIAGDEGISGDEGVVGIEGTSGMEGISGIEGASGIEGTPTSKPPTQSLAKSSSLADTRSMTDIPSNDDLIRAVVWAEILDKPKALRRYR